MRYSPEAHCTPEEAAAEWAKLTALALHFEKRAYDAVVSQMKSPLPVTARLESVSDRYATVRVEYLSARQEDIGSGVRLARLYAETRVTHPLNRADRMKLDNFIGLQDQMKDRACPMLWAAASQVDQHPINWELVALHLCGPFSPEAPPAVPADG